MALSDWSSTSGPFKDNTTGDIGADDMRSFATDINSAVSTAQGTADTASSTASAASSAVTTVNTELGTNPSGTYTTVKDRLDAIPKITVSAEADPPANPAVGDLWVQI